MVYLEVLAANIVLIIFISLEIDLFEGARAEQVDSDPELGVIPHQVPSPITRVLCSSNPLPNTAELR